MPEAPAVVCAGEAMVVLTPRRDEPLAEAEDLVVGVGGAELNVALTLARLGVPVAWLSRLGADGFGERVRRLADRHGVVLDGVTTDPDRPTGLYVKEPGTGGDGTPRSTMRYYRSGSAASALGPEHLGGPAVRRLLQGARTVLVSGITPGLSDTAAAFTAALVAACRAHGLQLVVDLNHRPALWQDREAGPLHALLRAADEVLLGADEARSVLGTDDPGELLAALPGARRVLLKAEAAGVRVLEPGRAPLHVPALVVDVVEPVGAGDAFAAGYVAGCHRGLDVQDAVLLGHRLAAAALVVRGDRPEEVPA